MLCVLSVLSVFLVLSALSVLWALLALAPLAGRWALPVVEEHLRLLRELRLFFRHLSAGGLRRELIAERDAIAREFEALASTPHVRRVSSSDT